MLKDVWAGQVRHAPKALNHLGRKRKERVTRFCVSPKSESALHVRAWDPDPGFTLRHCTLSNSPL